MKLKKIIPIIIIIALAAGGIQIFKKRKAELAKAKPAAVLPVVADEFSVTRGPVTLSLPAMGIVSSDISTTLSTKISGQVVAVYKKEGEKVARGDILARIDDRELRSKKRALKLKQESLENDIDAKTEQLSALQTALGNARKTHTRTKQLIDVKGASIEQYSQEETRIADLSARIKATQSAIAAINANRQALAQNEKEVDDLLSYTRITSPVKGTISHRMIQRGDLASPGRPLFRVAAATGRHLDVQLPAEIRVRAVLLGGRRLALTPLSQAGPSGLKQYRCAIPADMAAVEGQFLNISVLLYEGQDVLLPQDVLLSTNGKTYVFAYQNGSVKKIRLTIRSRGTEGVIADPRLDGSILISAKPDILLRVSTGVPLIVRKPLKQKPKARSDMKVPVKKEGSHV